ncbi:hypothetical protein GCM10010103_44410 [Streptomyces paradoxus]|uniref:Uncharacterized protein n=1 Tax=Streptomyces paradoxus TaxID=66375 RepID=A0A7W9TDU1_9ACTN|nr:hypothetical protein [Streptomyces paradoxus]
MFLGSRPLRKRRLHETYSLPPRLLAGALLVASVPAPLATMPATAAPAPAARHDHDDLPRHGLGPELTERHNGSIPGYETVTVYLASQKATLVIMINTDVVAGGQEPSTPLARAITAVATLGNVYDGSVVTRP